jgi:hypothetical protein
MKYKKNETPRGYRYYYIHHNFIGYDMITEKLISSIDSATM